MADEPDKLVLQLLREIRADIGEVKLTLSKHSKRFDRVDQRLEGPCVARMKQRIVINQLEAGLLSTPQRGQTGPFS